MRFAAGVPQVQAGGLTDSIARVPAIDWRLGGGLATEQGQGGDLADVGRCLALGEP